MKLNWRDVANGALALVVSLLSVIGTYAWGTVEKHDEAIKERGERIKALEVKQESQAELLREVRDDVKELLLRTP